MKVKELIAQLCTEDLEAEVVMAKDSKGIKYSTLSRIEDGRWYRDMFYTEGEWTSPRVICLWPED